MNWSIDFHHSYKHAYIQTCQHGIARGCNADGERANLVGAELLIVAQWLYVCGVEPTIASLGAPKRLNIIEFIVL